jgi:flagellar basal-body rod modification protein FlgD
MQVNPAAATSDSNTSNDTSNSATAQELSPNEFLKLLVSQLQNQDPLNPTDQSQFVGELAQMQSVSELQQMNTTLTASSSQGSTSSALAMLGRTVTWVDSQTSSTSTGIVSAVLLTSSGVTLKVGETDVPIGNVTQVAGS